MGRDGRDQLPGQTGQGRGVGVVVETVQQGQGLVMSGDLLLQIDLVEISRRGGLQIVDQPLATFAAV